MIDYIFSFLTDTYVRRKTSFHIIYVKDFSLLGSRFWNHPFLIVMEGDVRVLLLWWEWWQSWGSSSCLTLISKPRDSSWSPSRSVKPFLGSGKNVYLMKLVVQHSELTHIICQTVTHTHTKIALQVRTCLAYWTIIEYSLPTYNN